MSVVERLSKLFSKKSEEPQAETSGELSLGMPDASVDPMATGAMDASRQPPADPDTIDDSIDPPPDSIEADLISVPGLGRRPVVVHQRILFALLAMSLIVLGAVAYLAVSQASRVAQQVAGTGQSLMQSQRLAKSVSQALVGS